MLEEKRKASRFQGRFGFVSTDTDGLNFSFITDLSRDGAYIETEHLLPLGTDFNFYLSNGSTQAPVVGRVTRVRDAFFHGGKSGMGVRFMGLESMARNIRDDLLLFLMFQRYQAKWEQEAA